MDILETINKRMGPLARRVALVVGRGRIEQTGDEKGGQLLQVSLLDEETRDKVERFMEFGFTSHVPKSTDVIVVFPGGDRAQGIVVATNDTETRIKDLKEGETAVYNAKGIVIHLKDDKTLDIYGAETVNIRDAKTINIPDAETTTISGKVIVTGDVIAGGISLVGHIHTGDSGGTTSPPIG